MTLGFLGLHWSHDIDLVGVGTLLLAGATAYLALFTRKAVKQGATELAQSQRPVLVPLHDDRPPTFPMIEGGAVYPRVEPQYDQLQLAVRNVGPGPALQLSVLIEFESVPVRGIQRTVLGAAEAVVLIAYTKAKEIEDFRFEMRYEDVAGKRYVTKGDYLVAQGLYLYSVEEA